MTVRNGAMLYRMKKRFALSNIKKRYTRQVALTKANSILYSFFRLFLLAGLTYLICMPFVVKLSSSFMSKSDLYDAMVKFIPRNFTLENYRYVIRETEYLKALTNTVFISLLCAVLQTLSCAMIGYGLAKFKFKGRGFIMAIAIFTMIVPPDATINALYMNFKFFNPMGVLGLFTDNLPNLLDTAYPLTLLSATGFALKNGLYIILMRQFFKGVPDEMLEAAEVDGAGCIRTFFKIILPMAIPMLSIIFVLSFAWQWTDSYYSSLLFQDLDVLSNTINAVAQIGGEGYAGSKYSSVLINTSSVLILAPLILFYLFAQKLNVQSIERTGLVG